jgi:hypothetical protein
MSEERTLSVQELRRMIRLLERIHRLAEESSRRHMMEDGQTYLIQQYHAIVASLARGGQPLPDYFPPLGDEATLGMVGFASAQVAEYLAESIEAEEADRGEGDPSAPGGSFFEKFLTGGDFQHIGEAMRQAMPEWSRAGREWSRAERAARRGREREWEEPRQAANAHRPTPETAGQDAAPPEVNPDIDVNIDMRADLTHRLAAVNGRVHEIAGQMQQPDLPSDERQRLAAELARLGEQQAALAREMAAHAG